MGRREKVIRQRGIDCSVLALAASLSASVPSIFPSRSVLVHPSFYHSVTRLLHHFVPGDHLDPAVHMTVCLRETGDGDPVSVSSRAGSSVSLTHRPLPDTLHSHPPGNSPEHAGWCSCLPFVPRARSGGRGGEGGRGGRGLPCSLIMDPKVKAVRELCDGLTGMSPGCTMTHDSVALTALLQYRCSLRSRITLCPGFLTPTYSATESEIKEVACLPFSGQSAQVLLHGCCIRPVRMPVFRVFWDFIASRSPLVAMAGRRSDCSPLQKQELDFR